MHEPSAFTCILTGVFPALSHRPFTPELKLLIICRIFNNAIGFKQNNNRNNNYLTSSLNTALAVVEKSTFRILSGTVYSLQVVLLYYLQVILRATYVAIQLPKDQRLIAVIT